ncbi:hypothetical protein BpHYR1_022156 [Brachionus plicatilis]|uniref:C-type lectin domain-containing protein n=1 Tax=Brachionus plicatilis TaxID=10195 RepID=A0A3M7SKZ9_BRAPC|nr:hypothetical protein BpHYR1_022156 [Brachionus plicatilis]
MNLGILLGLISFGLNHALPINSACDHLPYDFHTISGTRDYFFLRYELRNADGAKQYCNSMGMELASVHSAAQNQLIHSFMKQTDVDNGLFHTSGRILPNNTFVWTNGDSSMVLTRSTIIEFLITRITLIGNQVLRQGVPYLYKCRGEEKKPIGLLVKGKLYSRANRDLRTLDWAKLQNL